MTSPAPRPRRGAHRTGRSVLAALVPSVLAVLAVASVITSLAVWRGQEPMPDQAALTADRAALSEASTAASGTAGPSSATSAASSEAGSPSPTPSGSPTSSSTTSPAPEQTTAAEKTTDPRTATVVVLNQTSRAGLAGQVARVLSSRGWTVPAVGNFRGVVSATTVYYPAGLEAAALAAAEDLPVPVRTRPRFGNLSETRLTVVVTDSYPG